MCSLCDQHCVRLLTDQLDPFKLVWSVFVVWIFDLWTRLETCLSLTFRRLGSLASGMLEIFSSLCNLICNYFSIRRRLQLLATQVSMRFFNRIEKSPKRRWLKCSKLSISMWFLSFSIVFQFLSIHDLICSIWYVRI